MLILWGTLMGIALWLGLVYHFVGFGWTSFNPTYAFFLIVGWTGIWTLCIGLFKGKTKKIIFYTVIWLPAVWTAIQLVYLRIFKQPLLWEAVIWGASDALTNYYREALWEILRSLPYILLLFMPVVLIPFLLKRLKWQMPQFTSLQVMRMLLIMQVGIGGSIIITVVGKDAELEFYVEYQDFYDPLGIAENMGILPLFQRDIAANFQQLTERVQRNIHRENYVLASSQGLTENTDSGNESASDTPSQSSEVSQPSASEADLTASSESSTEQPASETSDTQLIPEEPVIRPQQFNIDYDMLHRLADNDHQLWLADYIQGQTAVDTNEYTGMFEDYNLIYITAEGFCSYAIDEQLTPTLYRMANSGFVCTNYYTPLWQTSTSDGEYINLTGLIPDRQYSMRRSSENVQPFALPAFFAAEGVHSYAYHNNTLSYYSRHLSHPNMGYDYKACRLGDLDESVWGDKVFEMEMPGQWPASDYNMMVATVPEYVNNERFHAYYMTVSGHMYYTYKGNAMSAKNKDAVADLPLSESCKAYIACNIELDKAMENLLEQLEAAGQLDRTLICLSTDHYPYGLTDAEYEELAGRDLTAGKDKFRNTLILWNATMEEPVYIDKACGPMDLMPTLLNLLGFNYDSRMYAGRDILSDREGMVIFNNRDFVTDSLIFIEKGDITYWLQDENGNDIVPDAEKEAYLAAARREVKDRYDFSAYIIQENYYSDVLEAMITDDGE
ncbi:MAG: LTA synthase family protein [Lachnospiraceae bacterium]|nr:LTA synthase family protein [Lachnospiraceae bacterium]